MCCGHAQKTLVGVESVPVVFTGGKHFLTVMQVEEIMIIYTYIEIYIYTYINTWKEFL